MRGFFLLLLLTNVAFVAWQLSRDPGVKDSVDIYQGIAMVNEGLTMISELPPGKQPALREEVEKEDLAVGAVNGEPPQAEEGASSSAAHADAVAAGKPVAVGVCSRIDGIDNRAALDRILTLLRDNGATAIEQGEVQDTRTNFWVMLPPYPNREKADEAATILSGKKVKDYFIVRSGDYVNAVSLGVFSTRERAERRYRQIVGLNARLRRPKIEAIELPSKRYTVSYRIKDNATQSTLASALSGLKIRETEEIDCK